MLRQWDHILTAHEMVVGDGLKDVFKAVCLTYIRRKICG